MPALDVLSRSGEHLVPENMSEKQKAFLARQYTLFSNYVMRLVRVFIKEA